MSKLRRVLTALALVAALSLSACAGAGGGGGGNSEKSGGGSEKKAAKKNGKEKKQEDPIKKSATTMKSKLADMKDAINAGDMQESQRLSVETDAEWEKIEERMETTNPELTDRIKWQLMKILAGAQLAPLNTETLTGEIELLQSDLDELKERKGEKPKADKVDAKTGAAAMRYDLEQVKKAAEAGDSAKAQEKAKSAEKSWRKFEKEVKEQDKEQYQKVEDPLHSLLAAVKEFPLDKKKIDEQAEKINKALDDVAK